MLKIRLARGGTKKRPFYAIVVADSRAPRDGRFIEKLGTYNPLLKRDDPKRVHLKVEQIAEWLKKGAQPTDRVARFLANEGLVSRSAGHNPEKAVPGKKAQERAAEKAQKAQDLAEATAKAKAEAQSKPEPEADISQATVEETTSQEDTAS